MRIKSKAGGEAFMAALVFLQLMHVQYHMHKKTTANIDKYTQ